MSNVISISANEPVGPVVFPMDLIDSLDKRLEQLSGLIAVLAIELPPECHKRARYGVGLVAGEVFDSLRVDVEKLIDVVHAHCPPRGSC